MWAIQDGGYDPSTWYWGALLLLATLTAAVLGPRRTALRLTRASVVALVAFGLYVVWSYLSISWAGSRGDALQGSNRALLYLLVFALMSVLPWTAEGALVALLTFVLGVGSIALVMLIRLASATHVQVLMVEGRFLAPTGYFNSNAALFTMAALVATALAASRTLPGLLRGTLLALAGASLQLAVLGQSRGWLFTLPLVLIATFVLVRDRLRVAVAAVLPIAATLLVLHRLLDVYHSYSGKLPLSQAAARAGHSGLLVCAGILFVGTLIAWAETIGKLPRVSRRRGRQLGTAVTVLAVAAGCAGAISATNGHPIGFLKRQWNGFSNYSIPHSSQSYFAVVGSGRYDFWRVSLDAFLAHPLGGLGQDNFADYYITRRRTNEEPEWTHSLEMRLLAHTGLVGFLLFATFLIAAIAAALQPRRHGSEFVRWVSGAALLPLAVWLIHGSVDWFWEMPALSGPALGFLGMAGGLAPRPVERPAPLPRAARVLMGSAAMVGVLAAAFVLGLPYLSAREVSIATSASARDPTGALADLRRAAKLDPLSADPGRLAGTIALRNGEFLEAEQRFGQAAAREPGGWFAWLGEGLAASELGDRTRARHDFKVAASIDSLQPAVVDALARVDTTHPLGATQALDMLLVAP